MLCETTEKDVHEEKQTILIDKNQWKIESDQNGYKCLVCSLKFSSIDSLKRHKMEVHEENTALWID